MDEERILEAFRARDEEALSATRERYGPYIRKITRDILREEEEAAEAENDVYFTLWQRLEQEQPASLKNFIGMISRQTAIDRLRKISAVRRGGGAFREALEELEETIPAGASPDPADQIALRDCLNCFLYSLSRKRRRLFLCRYWLGMSVKECADSFGMSESAVKTALHRDREKLKTFLEKEELL